MFKVRRGLQSLLIAVFFSLVGFIGGYFLFEVPADNMSLKPESDRLIGTVEKHASGGGTTVLLEGINRVVEGRSYYSLCGHWEPLNLGSFNKLTSEYLLETFPKSQGWAIEDSGEKLLITKTINALCPDDENKRHLGQFQDFVAVIRGPVGINGGILEVTKIKVSSLPEHFRQQAKLGVLDFPDGQSLLEALDSMDEFGE